MFLTSLGLPIMVISHAHLNHVNEAAKLVDYDLVQSIEDDIKSNVQVIIMYTPDSCHRTV